MRAYVRSCVYAHVCAGVRVRACAISSLLSIYEALVQISDSVQRLPNQTAACSGRVSVYTCGYRPTGDFCVHGRKKRYGVI